MTDPLLAALAEMDEKATKGPWERKEYRVKNGEGYNLLESGCRADCPGRTGEFMSVVDAELVAALRNALPALVRLIECADAMRGGGECDVPGCDEPGCLKKRAYRAARSAVQAAITGGPA